MSATSAIVIDISSNTTRNTEQTIKKISKHFDKYAKAIDKIKGNTKKAVSEISRVNKGMDDFHKQLEKNYAYTIDLKLKTVKSNTFQSGMEYAQTFRKGFQKGIQGSFDQLPWNGKKQNKGSGTKSSDGLSEDKRTKANDKSLDAGSLMENTIDILHDMTSNGSTLKERNDNSYKGLSKAGMISIGAAAGNFVGSIGGPIGMAAGAAIGTVFAQTFGDSFGDDLRHAFGDSSLSKEENNELSLDIHDALVRHDENKKHIEQIKTMTKRFKELDTILSSGTLSETQSIAAKQEQDMIIETLAISYPQQMNPVLTGETVPEKGVKKVEKEVEKDDDKNLFKNEIALNEKQDDIKQMVLDSKDLTKRNKELDKILVDNQKDYEALMHAKNSFELGKSKKEVIGSLIETTGNKYYKNMDEESLERELNSMNSSNQRLLDEFYENEKQYKENLSTMGNYFTLAKETVQQKYNVNLDEAQGQYHVLSETREKLGKGEVLDEENLKRIDEILPGFAEELRNSDDQYGLLNNKIGEMTESFGNAVSQLELWTGSLSSMNLPGFMTYTFDGTPKQPVSKFPFPSLNKVANNIKNAVFDFMNIPHYAKGGILTSPRYSLVGEDGPESIIPLSQKRRDRGLSLWQKTGELLGVHFPAYQDDTGIPLIHDIDTNITPIKQNGAVVQVSVSASPSFQITSNGDGENVKQAIEGYVNEMLDDIGEGLATRLQAIFTNMPGKGSASI